VLRSGPAPAKLNLALELTGRRSDGYHQISAVSQTIDWSDVVALEGDDAGQSLSRPEAPEFRVWGPEARDVPRGSDNIAVRAAVLLRQSGLGPPISRLALEKRVPPRSGLGGGSADAAAVLRLAAPGADQQQLESIALQCGADVPFSLRGGACLLGGIGEKMAPLRALQTGAFLVVVLGAVATAAAYAATDPADFSDGSRVELLASALRKGSPLDPELFGSGLQPSAMRAVPILAQRLSRLIEATPGARWAMTGSGGAFFTYQPDASAAAVLAKEVAPACPGAPLRLVMPFAGAPE
jgi:4-diphosphocytidyl-2-C-methyl-D-erythritol kinase